MSDLIQELERRVADAAIAKYQAPLTTEVRSDGKSYFCSDDFQAWERCSDELNHAIRILIEAKESGAEQSEWPDVIDGC